MMNDFVKSMVFAEENVYQKNTNEKYENLAYAVFVKNDCFFTDTADRKKVVTDFRRQPLD